MKRKSILAVFTIFIFSVAGYSQDKNSVLLRPESRLEIIRFIYGEFVKAKQPLPGTKKGFLVKVFQPFDIQTLEKAVQKDGLAVKPGDEAQITKLEFRVKEIVIEINNGGGNKKKSWKERVQVQVGGVPTVSTTQKNDVVILQGCTLILDFEKPLPDMSSDDVKLYLRDFIDFSKNQSAVIQWYETLPLEIQKAIKEKKVALGMDQRMVKAALGGDYRKIREKDSDGNEIETWIYGNPPGKTIFLKFMDGKVIEIKEFP